eukprot:COSAG01_NODE_4851_length_4683_cov_2.011778_4_plen_53_part_00
MLIGPVLTLRLSLLHVLCALCIVKPRANIHCFHAARLTKDSTHRPKQENRDH